MTFSECMNVLRFAESRGIRAWYYVNSKNVWYVKVWY